MSVKVLSLVVTGFLFCAVNTAPVHSAIRTDGQPPIEEIKAKVLKHGTGAKARVKVKLMDGTKLKGLISAAGEESFVLTNAKTKQTTTVAYREVREVKGQGMSRGAKIGIGVAVGVGIAAVAVGLACKDFEIFPRQ
ncbi:MAG: hypothetical protein ACRD9R_21450 [Pyrinomonadaceae bacterium]